MLEKMDAFFEARLDGYDSHMMQNIAGAEAFYPFTAQCLPAEPGCSVLDLGCGTGLELEFYFRLNPTARVTGIDLSEGMLAALTEKFRDKTLDLRRGSYFDLPLGEACFDAAVSVESLHHFTQEKKEDLYRRLHAALKADGIFVLTDYFAPDDGYEAFCFGELARLRAEEGIADDAFYHYDTPLTVVHETAALRNAGFSRVENVKNWGATHTLIAYK